MLDAQKRVQSFCIKQGISGRPEERLIDTLSELGEAAKEILLMTGYGKHPPVYREGIRDELGDVFFSLLTLANAVGVDIEEALEQSIKKYEKRIKGG